MARIEIVEKDYVFGADLLGDYDSRDLIELIDKHLEAIREQMATGVEKRMQKVLEDIVEHTTVQLVGKNVNVNFDIHISFADSAGSLFALKIIPEAEVEVDDDYDDDEEAEKA